MSNDVTTTNGQAVVDPYQQYADRVTSSMNITGELLRFTKHGQWKYGQNLDPIAEGTRMLVCMPSLKVGWVKWVDQRPAQHIIGLVEESYVPPKREELGDMEQEYWEEMGGRKIDPWQEVNYILMCDEEGTIYTFASSSKGGISAVGEICKAYSKNRRMEPHKVPIIELRATSYIHREFGETFKPVLKVVGFAPIPDNFDDLVDAIASSNNTEGTDAPQVTFNLATPAEPTKVVKPTLVKPAPAPARKAPPPTKAAVKGGKRPVRF